jgi:hypothetical protein
LLVWTVLCRQTIQPIFWSWLRRGLRHRQSLPRGGDFLFIDQIENEQVIFVRAGTHADLFERKFLVA